MGDVAVVTSNATNDLQVRNYCNINIAKESPSEQSILELQSSQICYRDLMRIRNNLFCCESKLNWEIRFDSRHNLSEDQIRELREERKRVEERRKKIEKDKGPAQKQLEQWRTVINGNATVSSKEDPSEWGTHTPIPIEGDDDE